MHSFIPSEVLQQPKDFDDQHWNKMDFFERLFLIIFCSYFGSIFFLSIVFVTLKRPFIFCFILTLAQSLFYFSTVFYAVLAQLVNTGLKSIKSTPIS